MVDTVDILIVDDKINNLIALEETFSGVGATFIKATSGNDALREALTHDFALAILDVQMPEMDGYELAQLIRNRKQTSKLPIIFLSAIYSDDFHIFKGYDSGAVDFITKPFSPEILAGKIQFFIEIYLQKIKLKETIQELEKTKKLVLKQNRQLQRLSTHDDLTGLCNRRHLVASLEQEFNRCCRHGTELSLIMLDLDHFKNINDNFGHEFGDYVLKAFSTLLRTTVRKSDLVFRFGGEEFIVLLPLTGAGGAAKTAEKIRRKCEETMIDDRNYAVKITVSIGVTSYNKEVHQTASCMISFADEALYQAKESGRNRVVVYQGKNALQEKALS
ncbi:MAG: diguanylate cyclase [Candidatus Electrothrix sp. GW3-4]|uniref:GGDEF domain-containing response regulator n=1 Tax=Candidatus Electrothrix sp. GW3-4 TaxID=3126740 RepID=UPI0030CE6FBA